MNCSICTHVGICKFNDNYNKLKELLPTTEAPFTIEINCRHYKQEEETLKRPYFDQLTNSSIKLGL